MSTRRGITTWLEPVILWGILAIGTVATSATSGSAVMMEISPHESSASTSASALASKSSGRVMRTGASGTEIAVEIDEYGAALLHAEIEGEPQANAPDTNQFPDDSCALWRQWALNNCSTNSPAQGQYCEGTTCGNTILNTKLACQLTNQLSSSIQFQLRDWMQKMQAQKDAGHCTSVQTFCDSSSSDMLDVCQTAISTNNSTIVCGGRLGDATCRTKVDFAVRACAYSSSYNASNQKALKYWQSTINQCLDCDSYLRWQLENCGNISDEAAIANSLNPANFSANFSHLTFCPTYGKCGTGLASLFNQCGMYIPEGLLETQVNLSKSMSATAVNGICAPCYLSYMSLKERWTAPFIATWVGGMFGSASRKFSCGDSTEQWCQQDCHTMICTMLSSCNGSFSMPHTNESQISLITHPFQNFTQSFCPCSGSCQKSIPTVLQLLAVAVGVVMGSM